MICKITMVKYHILHVFIHILLQRSVYMFLATTCKLLDKISVHNDCMKTENIYITIDLNISQIIINYHYNVTPKFYPSKK